jgi:hypothetical protein
MCHAASESFVRLYYRKGGIYFRVTALVSAMHTNVDPRTIIASIVPSSQMPTWPLEPHVSLPSIRYDHTSLSASLCCVLSTDHPSRVSCILYSHEALLQRGVRLLCGTGGYPPTVLQHTEAYCTNPALGSPLHLQRRSTSDDVRGLY